MDRGRGAESHFYEHGEGAARAPLGRYWEPRRPEKTVLYRVVSEHLETLLYEARQEDEDRRGLPRYVEEEFRRYLDCGLVQRGLVRVRCGKCGKEEVVGFSCKKRGFCPSCLARRMADLAAHLTDRVLPVAPFRQWVLTVPFAHRLRLARDPVLLSAVRRAFTASVKAWQRQKARALGWRRARTGAVCFTQGFDSLLRVNPHFHALIPDAVFVEREEGKVELVALPKPRQEDVEWVAARVARRAGALLEKGREEEASADALDRLRVRQLELLSEPAPERAPGRLSARVGGFSLQAATHLHAHDRAGLEALARYALRPPVAQSRLSPGSDGRLILTLKRPLADGRSQLVLEPMTLMRRLAGLVPRPRAHQVHYFGVLSSHAGLREQVCPRGPKRRTSWSGAHQEVSSGQRRLPLAQRLEWPSLPEGLACPVVKAPSPRPRRLDWAALLARTFGESLLDCPCGGRRAIVAFVPDPEHARQVLHDLGLEVSEPRLGKARDPPQMDMFPLPPDDGADPVYPDD